MNTRVAKGATASGTPSFFGLGSAMDPLYAAIRAADNDHTCHAREVVESLWQTAAPYVDANIQRKAAVRFHPHFWELYLATCLLRANLSLVPRTKGQPADFGPDVRVTKPDLWIEAVTASSGTGRDSVTEGKTGTCREVPDDGIKLRILTAITEKVKKFAKYVADGTISPSVPCVIAVNSGAVPRAMTEAYVPRIVRCVFPFGHQVLEFSRKEGRAINNKHEYQAAVVKQNGANVPTTGFELPGWAGISAVVHSAVDVFNGTSALGREFVLVHNPHALNPLPLGLLRVGTECWADGPVMKLRRW